MSPHQYGWPVYRPRLYTLLINSDTMQLEGSEAGFQETLQLLHRRCEMDVSAVFVAPQARALGL